MTLSDLPDELGGIVTRTEALGYRSLRYLSQDLGAFHVLVGPNASGKSTFLDVVAFVGDILRGGLETAVQGDSRLGVPLRAPDAQQLTWLRQGGRIELAVEIGIPAELKQRLPNGGASRCRYEVAIDCTGPLRLASESLWLKPTDSSPDPLETQRTLFPGLRPAPDHLVRPARAFPPRGWKKVVSRGEVPERATFSSETSGWEQPFRLGPEKTALASLPEDEERFPVATWCRKFLGEGVQRLALSSDEMRRPSPPGRARTYLPDGSNLPHVISGFQTEAPERFHEWVRHVREALPDIETISTREREEDRHRYLVLRYANGLEAPSWLVSDGTLRLLALTLLAYLPNLTGLYLIEEPENGIHPRAVETVFQSLSSVYGAQVLLATHSPIVAGMARLDDILCFGRTAEGATDVVSGVEHPRLKEWRGTLDPGMLLAAGVLG